MCDVGPSDPPDVDNTRELCDADYAALLAGPATDNSVVTVYVFLLCLPAFVERVWPHVRRRVVLVTGMSDPGPAKVLGAGACAALAADPRVVAWFTEMRDFAAQKVRALPLGIDYHTLAYKPHERPGWGPPQPPGSQEVEFLAVARAAPPAAARDPRCFVHFGWYTPARRAVLRATRGRAAAFYFEPDRHVPRAELWRRMATFRWVLCVQGGGLDCHRTWEALGLGCGVVGEALPMLEELLGRTATDEGDSERGSAPLRPLPHLLMPTRDRAGWRDRVTLDALDALHWDARDDPRLTNAYWADALRRSALEGASRAVCATPS